MFGELMMVGVGWIRMVGWFYFFCWSCSVGG